LTQQTSEELSSFNLYIGTVESTGWLKIKDSKVSVWMNKFYSVFNLRKI